MQNETIRKRLEGSPRLKKLIDRLVMNQVETRPRWFVRLLAPLYQQRGRHSVIHRSVRMDTPPYRRFSLGAYSVVESFACINNAVGDVVIGHHTRIGLHNTVIGPVSIGNHVNLAQGITVTALNHQFNDPHRRIDEQGITTTPVTICDDVWVGAHAVILPGVTIGSHSVVAAGAVVTGDVPPPLARGRSAGKNHQKVMRIGIEAQRIFRKNKHGMDYVVLQEIKELQQLDTRNEYFVFVAPGDDRCLEDTRNVHVIETGSNFYPLWEQFSLPRAARELELDLLHCTSNTAPLRCKIPLVLTLHDIIFLEPRDQQNRSLYQNLGWLYRRLVVPRVLRRCRRIITVSEFERRNILAKLRIPEKRITMIYNGYNEWFRPTADARQVYRKYIDAPGYFLFLGNTDPKKNTERTLIAYSRYLEKSKVKRKLLLADLDKAYLDDIIDRHQLSNIRHRIVMPGYIPNNHLPFIYNHAFAFLYTSLRESFGIPLLEAMACGTPVITSNTSSMPEIAGAEAILVNPEDSDAIADKMIELEEDEGLYRKQEEMGLERAGQFSWRRTAELLLDVYESVYKHG